MGLSLNIKGLCNKSNMIDVELEENMVLTVDPETAEQLKDPQYAERYLKLIKGKLNTVTEEKASTLWKSKQQSNQDHQATKLLLALRNTYNAQFADKSTSKNTLWSHIRDELNSMGFFVGEGMAGREKVRQKFANLQSSYIKTKEKRRRTGEGKVDDAPYFKELDEILGDKHKIEPVLILDSLEENKENLDTPASTPTPHCSGSSSSVSDVVQESDNESSSTSNRFNNIRNTVRPPTTSKKQAFEELLRIQKENQQIRKNEFQAMMELFTQQSKQRHEETLALIKAMGNSNNSARKRKRSEDSDD